MSEHRSHGEEFGAAAVIEGVLAAVERPACLCTADGRIACWNDDLCETLALAPGEIEDTQLASLVDCEEPPVDRAIETGTEATVSGTVSVEGDVRPCLVTSRPLAAAAIDGAVVTLSLGGEDGEGVWSLYGASVDSDASGEYVYAVDTDGMVQAVGGGFASETGVSADEITGQHVHLLASEGVLSRQTIEQLEYRLEALCKTDRTQATFNSRTTDGKEQITEHRLNALHHRGEVVGAVGVARDVTERVQTTEALRESHARLSSIIENLPAVVLVVGTDGTVEHFRGSGIERMGYDRQAVLGTNIEDFDEAAAGVTEHCERALDGEEIEATVEINGRTLKAFFEPLDRGGRRVGTVATAVDITERKERQREVAEREERLRTVVDSSPDPILLKDTSGEYQLVNEATIELTGVDRETFVGSTPADIFSEEHAEQIRAETERVLAEATPKTTQQTLSLPGGERTFLTTRAPHYGPDGEIQGTVSVSRDVTERQRQQDQLETLAQIQQLIHESVGALADVTTQAEIKTTVCERLGGSEFYELAWIGTRASSSQVIEPDTQAGIAAEYVEEITVTVDPSESGRGPAGRAYRTGEVCVTTDVDDDPDFERWRDLALEHGLRSVAGVPLTHGSTTHGVLVVYSDRPAGFSDRELAAFETLGETVGFALSAAQNRRLLESERVQTLEFEISGDSVFTDASTAHDCRFVFEGAIGTGSGQTVCYMTAAGIDGATAAEVASASPQVERCSRLDGGESQFEVLVTDSYFDRLADLGARGTRIVVEDGVTHVVAQAPVDLEVRRVSEALAADGAGVEIATRREGEPTDTGWRATATHGTVGNRLTDRQRAVLRAAYYSGYYEWPRETDAEGLADSLDIATTTLLQHLRKGHGHILAALFDS